jgi:NAD-dependent deacetylase
MRLHAKASIVVLTGAGISAESGLTTFRDSGGLWENQRVEDVATPEAFQRNPLLVHGFYNNRRAQLKAVQPNAAHRALARLEAEWPSEVLVVTQNVDDLHERAGTRNLIHMHGELTQARCMNCRAVHRWQKNLLPEVSCPSCGRKYVLRPNIVWFGEMPFEMERINQALQDCGMFLAVGTSGVVYPAAGLVEMANPCAFTVELNLEASAVASSFLEQRLGRATERVPEMVEELLAGLASKSPSA